MEDGGWWLEQKFNRERKTQLNPKESEENDHGNGPITVAGDASPAAAHRATLLGGWANSVSVYFSRPPGQQTCSPSGRLALVALVRSENPTAVVLDRIGASDMDTRRADHRPNLHGRQSMASQPRVFPNVHISCFIFYVFKYNMMPAKSGFLIA